MKNLILPLCLAALSAAPCIGQASGRTDGPPDPAAQAMIELAAELRELIRLLGARADFEARSAGIRQVAALDGAVLEIDRELRRTLEERESLAREIREAEGNLERAERNASSDSLAATLAEQARGYARELRADLAERRIRLTHLDERLDDLRVTLARRMALREALEDDLDPGDPPAPGAPR